MKQCNDLCKSELSSFVLWYPDELVTFCLYFSQDEVKRLAIKVAHLQSRLMKVKNKHIKSGSNSLSRMRASTNEEYCDDSLKRMSSSPVSRFLSSRVWRKSKLLDWVIPLTCPSVCKEDTPRSHPRLCPQQHVSVTSPPIPPPLPSSSDDYSIVLK